MNIDDVLDNEEWVMPNDGQLVSAGVPFFVRLGGDRYWHFWADGYDFDWMAAVGKRDRYRIPREYVERAERQRREDMLNLIPALPNRRVLKINGVIGTYTFNSARTALNIIDPAGALRFVGDVDSIESVEEVNISE